jgi:FMN phosphatase YigB (HAD superfamily)
MTTWDEAAAAAGMGEQRGKDLQLLEELVAADLRDYEDAAFRDMLAALEGSGEGTFATLSNAQRAWAYEVAERVGCSPDYVNLVSSGRVPRGREVPTPAVLQNLPKKPPGRR